MHSRQYNPPPRLKLMEPGPGVAARTGVLPPTLPPQMIPVSMPDRQALFAALGMQIRWDVSGITPFDSDAARLPGRQNFGSRYSFG